MEQAQKQSSLNLEHKQSTSQSPLVEVSRTFNAPVEKVWKAWSDPAMLKEWWGPVGFTAPTIKTDFRVGGKYLFAMKDNEGKVVWSTGTYEQIVPNKLLVWTDQFSDENGNPKTPQELGLPQEFGDGAMAYVTIEFEDKGDQTEMRLSHEGLPKAIHDDCVTGWTSSLDKMQDLVEGH